MVFHSNEFSRFYILLQEVITSLPALKCLVVTPQGEGIQVRERVLVRQGTLSKRQLTLATTPGVASGHHNVSWPRHRAWRERAP